MKVEIRTPNIEVEFDLCDEGVRCVEVFAAIMYGIEKGIGDEING